MSKHHLWQGQWLDDQCFAMKLESLASWLNAELSLRPSTPAVLAAAAALSGKLQAKAPIFQALRQTLQHDYQIPEADAEDLLAELAEAISRPSLERKLTSELGSVRPQQVVRKDYQDHLFEAWAPLGFVVHISPQNSPTSGVLSLLEGLLSGNINLLKTGRGEGLFAQEWVKALGDCDPSGDVQRRCIVAKVSSRQSDWLGRIFGVADAVAAWGGEEAIQAIRAQVATSTRLVEWGHKISFIYIAADCLEQPHLMQQIATAC